MTQEEVIKKVVAGLESCGIPYMLTGAIAVNYYGRPRLTHDIDIIVEVKIEKARELIITFEDEFYISLDGVLDAIQNHTVFNLIHHQTGLKIDCWILKDDEFDQMRFSRRQRCYIFDQEMFISSPEDLILMKLCWYKDSGSEKHLLDVRGIYQIQSGKLNKQYLESWAQKLSVKDLLPSIT